MTTAPRSSAGRTTVSTWSPGRPRTAAPRSAATTSLRAAARRAGVRPTSVAPGSRVSTTSYPCSAASQSASSRAWGLAGPSPPSNATNTRRGTGSRRRRLVPPARGRPAAARSPASRRSGRPSAGRRSPRARSPPNGGQQEHERHPVVAQAVAVGDQVPGAVRDQPGQGGDGGQHREQDEPGRRGLTNAKVRPRRSSATSRPSMV